MWPRNEGLDLICASRGEFQSSRMPCLVTCYVGEPLVCLGSRAGSDLSHGNKYNHRPTECNDNSVCNTEYRCCKQKVVVNRAIQVGFILNLPTTSQSRRPG